MFSLDPRNNDRHALLKWRASGRGGLFGSLFVWKRGGVGEMGSIGVIEGFHETRKRADYLLNSIDARANASQRPIDYRLCCFVIPHTSSSQAVGEPLHEMAPPLLTPSS